MLVSIICVIDSENLPLSNSEVSCKLFIIVNRHVMDSMFASTVVDHGFKPSMFASTVVDRGFKPSMFASTAVDRGFKPRSG